MEWGILDGHSLLRRMKNYIIYSVPIYIIYIKGNTIEKIDLHRGQISVLDLYPIT